MNAAPSVADMLFEMWWRGLPETLPQGSKAQMRMAYDAGMAKGAEKMRIALEAIAGAAVLDGIKYIPESGAVLQRIAQNTLGLDPKPVRIFTDERFKP